MKMVLALGLVLSASACATSARVAVDPPVGVPQLVRVGATTVEVTPIAVHRSDSGDRFTVELRLTDIGGAVADVRPAPAVSGRDSAGRQVDGDTIMNGAVDPLIPISYRLAPGDTVDGTVGLNVPSPAVLATLRFAPPGQQGIGWRLGAPAVTPAPLPGGWPAPTWLGRADDVVGQDYPDSPSDTAPLAVERLSVTVTRVVDPATPREPTPDAAPPGMRMVAVEVSVHNVGANPFDPINLITAADTRNRVYSDQLSSTAAGADLPTSPIAPGATVTGYVTVAVPDDATLGRIRASLARGGPPSVRSWQVG